MKKPQPTTHCQKCNKQIPTLTTNPDYTCTDGTTDLCPNCNTDLWIHPPIKLILKRGPTETVIQNDGSRTQIKVTPHYELHYDNHVDFITLNSHKLGTSKVHPIK